VSGLPVDRFCFEGFLPPRRAARRERLGALAAEPRTLVLFEAPHRVREAMADLVEVLGEARPATIARELTKVHEQVSLDTLGALAARLESAEIPARGEFVLIVSGAEADGEARAHDGARVLDILLEELAPGRAASLAARITGAPRKALYRRALGE